MYRYCATINAVSSSTRAHVPSTSLSSRGYPAFQAPPRPVSFSKHTKSTVDVPEEKLRKKLGQTDWTAAYTHDLRDGLAKDQTGAGKRGAGKMGGQLPHHGKPNASLRDNDDNKMRDESQNLAKKSADRSDARRSSSEDTARASTSSFSPKEDDSTLSKATEKVADKYEEYKEKAADVLNGARAEVREAAAKVGASEKDAKDVKDTVIETAKDWSSKAASTVWSAGQKVKETIQETAEQAKQEGKPFTTKAAENAREKINEMSQTAAQKVDDTFGSGTSEKISNAATTATAAAATAAHKAADVAGSAWHKMTETKSAEDLKEKGQEMLREAKDKVTDTASKASSKVGDGLEMMKDKVKQTTDTEVDTDNIVETIKQKAGELKDKVKEAAMDPLEKQVKHTLERSHPNEKSGFRESQFSNLSAGDRPVGDAKKKNFKRDQKDASVIERAESAAEAARDSAGRVTDAAAEQVSKAKEQVKAKGEDLMHKAGDVARDLKGKVEKSWDAMKPAASDSTLPRDEWAEQRSKAMDQEKELKDVTREDLKKAQEAVGVIIPTNEGDGSGVIKATAEHAREGVKSAAQVVKDRVMQGVDKLKEAAPGELKKAAETVKHVAEDAAAKVEDRISHGVGEEHWREFRQLFSGLSENAKNTLRAAWNKNAATGDSKPTLLTQNEVALLRKLGEAASSSIAQKSSTAWQALKEAALRPKVELDGPPLGYSMALKDQDDLMDRLGQLRFSESYLRDLHAEPRQSDTEAAAAPPTTIPEEASSATSSTTPDLATDKRQNTTRKNL